GAPALSLKIDHIFAIGRRRLGPQRVPVVGCALYGSPGLKPGAQLQPPAFGGLIPCFDQEWQRVALSCQGRMGERIFRGGGASPQTTSQPRPGTSKIKNATTLGDPSSLISRRHYHSCVT